MFTNGLSLVFNAAAPFSHLLLPLLFSARDAQFDAHSLYWRCIYSTNQRIAVNKNLCHKDEDVERLRKYLTVSAWESAIGLAFLPERRQQASQPKQASGKAKNKQP